MKSTKNLLVAIAISLAGVAVHANAASGIQHCDAGACMQSAPLAAKGELQNLAENGFSRTPLGRNLQMIAEDGSSHTSQSDWLHAKASMYQV